MRKDVTPKDVARLWFKGWNVRKIARYYNCHWDTVDLRLKTAKTLYPKLPWGTRRNIKSSERPNCELQCNNESLWVVGFTDGPEQHFFCGWHAVSGIRATRTFNEETVTIRELK